MIRPYRFLNNYRFIYALCGLFFLEGTLDSGLLQNSGAYLSYFKDGAFRLALCDASSRPVYQNKNFRFPPSLDFKDEAVFGSYRYQKKSVAGGILYSQEDLSELFALQKQLRAVQNRLDAGNQLLKKRAEAEPELTRLRLQEELIQRVESEIANENKVISALVDVLPDQFSTAERPQQLAVLASLKIRLCFLKQRCLFLIRGSQQSGLDPKELNLSVSSLGQDLKALGFDFGVMNLSQAPYSLNAVLAINAAGASLLEAFGETRGSLFVQFDPRRHTCNVRVTPWGTFKASLVKGFTNVEQEDEDYLFCYEEHP